MNTVETKYAIYIEDVGYYRGGGRTLPVRFTNFVHSACLFRMERKAIERIEIVDILSKNNTYIHKVDIGYDVKASISVSVFERREKINKIRSKYEEI